jgi:hypothetical protein
LQEWPAYFRFRSERTRFVGVDALIQRSSPRYTQLRALAEYLPFRAGAFDQVVFATSLDHFGRSDRRPRRRAPGVPRGGEILVWVGEKKPGAPRRRPPPSGTARLVKPEQADDVFHLKRLAAADAKRMCERAGLRLAEELTLKVDEFRSNHFFRLRIGDDRAGRVSNSRPARVSNADRYHFSDFTRENFRRLLRLARERYTFRTYANFARDERFLLWRHDVDFSPHAARKLAEIEADEGIVATLFPVPPQRGPTTSWSGRRRPAFGTSWPSATGSGSTSTPTITESAISKPW